MSSIARVSAPPWEPRIASSATVVIAARDQLDRASLRALIEGASDIVVLGEAEAVAPSHALARRTGANVVLMATRDIDALRTWPSGSMDAPALVVVTARTDPEFVKQAFRQRVAGFVTTDLGGDILLSALRQVAAGAGYVSPSVPSALIADCLADRVAISSLPGESRIACLSERERDIMRMVAEGESNRAIADALGLSIHTVDSHRRNIMRKLGLSSIVDLIRLAVREGVVTLGR